MLGFQLPAAWRSPQPVVRRGRLAWAGVGALIALWLIYVELFSLDAICLYCTAVHALSITLFGLSAIGTAATAPDLSSTDDDDDPVARAANPAIGASARSEPRDTAVQSAGVTGADVQRIISVWPRQ